MTYLLNSWYCAGMSADLTERPVGRKMFDKKIVMYRDSTGAVIALDGVCPHRFAPLDRGVVVGDNLMCPYHGLQFDKGGACVLNPHGQGIIPPAARVQSYAVAERNGIIWFWPGDADMADESQIIDFAWIEAEDHAVFNGHMLVNANYELVSDNLLDLTHAPFLHVGTLSSDTEDSIGGNMEYDFHMDGEDIIHSNYLIRDLPHPAPVVAPLWGDRPADFRAEMTWHPASTLEFMTIMSPPGAEDKMSDSVRQPSLHLLTPETMTSTHYFYVFGRNVQLDNEEYNAFSLAVAKKAFEQEDEPMVRACQENMGTTDLFSLKPAILQTDIAAVQARRILAKRIKSEAIVTP